jgi:hypothetical protein
MTVKELINVLSKIEDKNLRVVSKGYEGGYDDLIFPDDIPITMDLALNVNPEWWYGDHARISLKHHTYDADVEIVKAILI